MNANEVKPVAGAIVEPDEWGFPSHLVACDWATFRLLSVRYEGVAYACNVTITGRTFQRRRGGLWIRVKIDFINDAEPTTTQGGWMMVDWYGQPIVTN
jgi:hypothetical protein